MKTRSLEYTIWGDLDGMSVKSLKDQLSEFPDDAVIKGKTLLSRGFGESTETDVIVIEWKE